MEQLQSVIIGTHRYPIKIDLNVLEQIQDNYGSINAFEMELLGLGFTKDSEGHQVLDDSGKPVMYKKEPSIKAIRAALYPMINEGLEIEAEETGKEFHPVTKKFIERESALDYQYLADVIHGEFKRCFNVKKTRPEKVTEKMMSR